MPFSKILSVLRVAGWREVSRSDKVWRDARDSGSSDFIKTLNRQSEH